MALGPDPGPAPEDPLARLGEQIRRTQEAAERVMAQASGGPAGVAPPPTPPRGWASAEPAPEPGLGPEAGRALQAVLELARSVLPAELAAQLGELLRELLRLVRTLVALVLDSGARPAAEREVQDIPIG